MAASPRLVLLPMALTLGRLFAVPLIVVAMLMAEYRWALVIFLAAGISDALDGMLARLLDARTTVGGYLDPIADKVMLVCVYILLGYRGMVPEWLAVLVVFRDAMIIGGVVLFVVVHLPVTMAPLAISKLNTLVQITFAGWTLGAAAYHLDYPGITLGLLALTTFTTLASGFSYIAQSSKRLISHDGRA